MFIEAPAYRHIRFVVTFAPLVSAVAIYFYCMREKSSLLRLLLLYLLSIFLFFLSLYLWTHEDSVYPAVKLWVVEKHGKNFQKKEMYSLFSTRYNFSNGGSCLIDSSEDLALVNNTNTDLIVDVGVFSTRDPKDFKFIELQYEELAKKVVVVKPFSAGYFQQLDYFGYGKDRPPKDKFIEVPKQPWYSIFDWEKFFWVRW